MDFELLEQLKEEDVNALYQDTVENGFKISFCSCELHTRVMKDDGNIVNSAHPSGKYIHFEGYCEDPSNSGHQGCFAKCKEFEANGDLDTFKDNLFENYNYWYAWGQGGLYGIGVDPSYFRIYGNAGALVDTNGAWWYQNCKIPPDANCDEEDFYSWYRNGEHKTNYEFFINHCSKI